jgi:hypothetical protein
MAFCCTEAGIRSTHKQAINGTGAWLALAFYSNTPPRLQNITMACKR